MSILRLLPTLIVKYLLRTFYWGFCHFFRINPHKVTFASYRSDHLRDNLAFVHEAMVKLYPQYKPTFLFKKLKTSVLGKFIYIFHMIRACYHLATSRYFIIDDFYFPIYVIKPRKGMEIIQLWHSAGALKKFGLSTVGKPFGPSREYLKHVHIHGNYSKAYVSSKEVIPFFAEAFQMPKENIYPLGVPRTDYFFSKETTLRVKTKFYEIFPELQGKKIILYAPTFRGKSHEQEQFVLPFDVDYLKEQLQEEYVLFIHLHPYMQKQLDIKEDGFLYHIKDTFEIQELLIMTDILITDYSTVFFDFSLLKRPMIFYAYDLEEYIEERDFYYRYEEVVPGPIAKDTKTLVEYIKHPPFSEEEISRFCKRFFDYRDGQASERIVRHIIEGKIEQHESIYEKEKVETK